MSGIIAFLTTGWGKRIAGWAAAALGIVMLLLKVRSAGKDAANAEHAANDLKVEKEVSHAKDRMAEEVGRGPDSGVTDRRMRDGSF
jgi:hypothetical protein